MVKESKGETHEFQADIPRLINLIAKSLYQHREIFLRELISNAADALNKARFEHLVSKKEVSNSSYNIRIRIDKKNKTLTVSDNGIGMTKEELIENLGTIARSGTLEFLERIKDEAEESLSAIGQFGVGFYSVFMVADEVTVITKSMNEDSSWQWVSTGTTAFTISPGKRVNHGTDVILKLRKDAKEFLDEEKIKELVKTYSNYIEFPIYLGDEEEPLNEQKPLWRREKKQIKDEDYKSFYRTLVGVWADPLMYLHFVSEAPTALRAILYIPDKRPMVIGVPEEWGLKLYSRNVLISPKFKELLPRWLWFMQGVVDADDIPLNISRETVQLDPILKKLRKSLLTRILRWFATTAKKNPELYGRFWKEFGVFLKDGYIEDQTSRKKIVELLRFKSRKHPNEWISLKQYVEEMPEEQKEILYVIAETDHSAANSPHLESIPEDRDVLFYSDPIDAFLAMHLTEYEEKPLKNVESFLEDEEKSEELDKQIEPLIKATKEILGAQVSQVKATKALKDSPARLRSQAPMLTAMHKVMSYASDGSNYDLIPNILEYNVDHPLIKSLNNLASKNPDDNGLKIAIKAIHASLKRLEGVDTDPVEDLRITNELLHFAFVESEVLSKEQENE